MTEHRNLNVNFTLDIDTMTAELLDDPVTTMQWILADLTATLPRRFNDTTTIFDEHGQRIGDLNFVAEADPHYMPSDLADRMFGQD